MREPFQLPSVNALVSADKDVLRMVLNMLVKEINGLRDEIAALQAAARKGAGYG